MEDLGRNFVSIAHNGYNIIYLLESNGFVWKFNTNPDVNQSDKKFYSLSFIPLINHFAIKSKTEVYFVGHDGSLWCEVGISVNKIMDSGALKVFSNNQSVFVLCENGRILKEKDKQFSEICSFSNVNSIVILNEYYRFSFK